MLRMKKTSIKKLDGKNFIKEARIVDSKFNKIIRKTSHKGAKSMGY